MDRETGEGLGRRSTSRERITRVKRGNKVIKLSAEENARWVAKAQPLFDRYVKKMKAKGLPGQEVLKFCREYIKTHPK